MSEESLLLAQQKYFHLSGAQLLKAQGKHYYYAVRSPGLFSLYLLYKTGLYTDPIEAMTLLQDYRRSDRPNSLWVDFNLSKCYIRCLRFVKLR